MLTEVPTRIPFNGRSSTWIIENHERNQKSPADYETVIATTGYGLFNILMLLAALPVGWTCVLDTTVTTFFIQSTECDFELTLVRRGVAVGIVYIGMIIAGPLWDFIFQDCVISYFGKRNVMIIALLLDSICNVAWAHATSYYTFILFKFFNGILIAGPLSLLMPYLSEFHAPTYQPTFTKWANLLFALANIFPPALASVLILQTSWFNLTIFSRFFATWRIYMLICTIPPVLGIFTMCLMPKSPKYLLFKGQSNEALRVFKAMHSMNNLESPNSFKFTKLIPQQRMGNNFNSICKDKLQDSILKLKTLFTKPHLGTFCVILMVQFVSMLGFNTMRLWVPQLFITLNNFKVLIKSYYPVDETITMCEMLFPRLPKIDYRFCNYTMPDVESAVYFNSTIIAASAVFLSFLFTLISDTDLKKFFAIILSFFASTIGAYGSNWAVEIPYILLLCATIIVSMRISGNVIVAYVAEVTPDVLRPTATNSVNFIGNVGAAFGTIVFSIVLGVYCLAAFVGIGCLTLLCYGLSFLLPRNGAFATEETKEDVERF